MTEKLKLLFRPTIDHAAEAVARAGGGGTADEIEAFQDSAQFRQAVRHNCTRTYITEQLSNGYYVADAYTDCDDCPTAALLDACEKAYELLGQQGKTGRLSPVNDWMNVRQALADAIARATESHP